MLTPNEIQRITEILPEIIVYWRIEFQSKWVVYQSIPKQNVVSCRIWV